MADVTRQLQLNIVTSNTWTQLVEQGGAAYTVPVGSRSDVKWMQAINFGADSITVEFAIATSGSIVNAERLWPPIPLVQNERAVDDYLRVMGVGYRLWGRAVGATVDAVFQSAILEVTP